MLLAIHIPAMRKIAGAVLLGAVAGTAYAGALAEGLAIAGELYAASLVGASRSAPKTSTAEPAGVRAPSTPGKPCGGRTAEKVVPPSGRRAPGDAPAPAQPRVHD
jgi:hypothetical protein